MDGDGKDSGDVGAWALHWASVLRPLVQAHLNRTGSLESGRTSASRNSIPWIVSGRRFWPSSLRHFFLADSINWGHGRRGIPAQAALGLGGSVPDGGECALRIRCPDVGAVLGQAFDGPVMFHALGLDAEIEGCACLGFGFRIQMSFRCALPPWPAAAYSRPTMSISFCRGWAVLFRPIGRRTIRQQAREISISPDAGDKSFRVG